MSELPLALAQAVGPVRWGTPALALARGGNRGAGYSIATPSGEIHARSVIVATDALTAATLLDTATAGESQALAEIPHAPVAVVGLGFRRSAVAHPLDGFGFLVPRGLGGGLRILGCVFGSTIFEGRAPKDAAALTIFLGGRTDPELVAKSEREIVDVAEREVASVLGITEPALARVVRKWERGIPQFERGHARFVAAAERIESNLPGLALAGNWRWGVSVPNAIQAGERAAARIGDHAAA